MIVPIFIPTARALGIDMVHFGVVVVVNLMIGLVTPPYGLLLFVVASVSRSPLLPIIRDMLPFLVALLDGTRAHHIHTRSRSLAAEASGLHGLMAPAGVAAATNLQVSAQQKGARGGPSANADLVVRVVVSRAR